MICFIIKMHCKRVLQMQNLHGVLQRFYSVHAARSQRAHGALEDPTELPQRAV